MQTLMQREGREPVWGAMESNEASLTLARRLGFTAVDEIIVLSRGQRMSVTRGFGEERRRP